MSAASVVSPLTTDYIQSPNRFRVANGTTSSPARTRSSTQLLSLNGNTIVGPYQSASSSSFSPSSSSSSLPNPTQRAPSAASLGGVIVSDFEGRPPRVIDTQANPITLGGMVNPFTSEAESYSPTKRLIVNDVPKFTLKGGPRVNPNSRTSPGFPLAVTSMQAAEHAARQAADRAEWEMEQQAIFDRARLEAEEEDRRMAEEKQQKQQQDSLRYEPLSPTRQVRNSKMSYRDRIVPPKPNWEEDPLTALASEHTGIYPGPINRLPTFQPSGQPLDREPCAPEGTKERELQKLRANPLLDPTFQGKTDAAGLGYGRKHKTHFRYLSHWVVPDAKDVARMISQNNAAMSGYRSKSGLGYREEVRGLGWGHEHRHYNSVVSVRRAEDVWKDYPNGLHCLKLYNRTK